MIDFLFTLLISFILICALTFIISLVYAIFAINEEERKKALKYMAYSIMGFIIGFGTCLANINLGGMH